MATFNPQFSENTPNYLGWSKPAEEPKADQSTGIALKTAGNALEGSVEIADNAIKGTIKDDLYKQIDTKRQEFTDALTAVRNGGPSNTADANAATNQDLMPDQGSPAPMPIVKGLQRINNLQNGYTNGAGKMSETEYYRDLGNISKDMRTQWPGYRDYIDSEVSKITGGNPANEVIKSTIADINRNQTNAAKEQEYYEKAIVNSGFDKATDVLSTFKQDHDVTKVQNWLAKNNIAQQDTKNKLSDFQLSNAQRGDDQSKAEDAAYRLADHAGTAYFYNRNIVQNNNAGGSTPSAADISDQLFQAGANPKSIDPDQMRTLGTQLQTLEARSRMDIMTQLRTTRNADGKTAYDVLGPQKVNQIVDDTIGKLYGAQHKLLADQNTGLLYATQNEASDMVNSQVMKVLHDPSVGGVALTSTVLNKLMPNMSPGMVEAVNGQYVSKTNPNSVGLTGVASDLIKLSQVQKKLATTQTGGAYAGGPTGNIYTFKQFQDEQDRAQNTTGGSDKDKAAATTNFLGLRKAFTEKDPRVVDNAITTFFDPTNRGTLNKYMDDYYDPSRKVIVKGRTGAFEDLTSPDITKAVWDRHNNGNAAGWEFYKSWSRGEAIPALTTISKTWNTNETQLENNKTLHGAEGNIPSGTDHHFYWDSDKGQIGITNLKGEPMDVANTWRLNPDIFAVRNANIYLKSLRNIAVTEGSDPNAFAFKALKDAGWAPPSLDVKGTSTVSDRIIKAIVTSHTPPPDFKDRYKGGE